MSGAGRRSVILTAVFAAWAVAPAWAASHWQRTFQLTGPAALRLSTSQGGVQVRSWDENSIQVRVRVRGWSIGPDGVRITARQNGGEVTVRIRTPRHDWGWADHDVHVWLMAPRRVRLHLRSGDGDLNIRGVNGPIWLRSGDGDITAEALASGDLVAHSGDGNLRLTGRFGSVQASSGDGDIHFQADTGSAVRGAWMLRTGDGNLSVELPAGLAADVDARTGDGSIHLEGVQLQSGADRHHVHGQLHGGGGLVALRTGDGSIRLARD